MGSVFGTATAPLFYPGDGSPFTNALGTVTQTTKALGGGANTGAETVTIGAVYYDGTTAPPGYVGYGSPFTSNTATVGSVNGTAAGYKASVTQGSYAYGGGLNDTGTASLSIVGSPFGTNTASVGSVFGTATAPSFYAGDGTPFGTASGTVTQTTKAIGGGVSTAADVVTIGAVYGDGVSPYKGYVGYGSAFTSNSATVGSVTGHSHGYTASTAQGTYAYGGGLNQAGSSSATLIGSPFSNNIAGINSVTGTATGADAPGFKGATAKVVQHSHAFGGGLDSNASTVTIGQRYYDATVASLVSFPSAFTNNQAYVSSATGTTTGFGADTRQYTKAGGGGAFLHGDYGPTYIYDGTFDQNQARATNITSSATSANGTAYDKSYTSVVGGGLADLYGYLYVDPTSFTNNQAMTDTVGASSTGIYYATTKESSFTAGGGFFHLDGYAKIIDGDFENNLAQGTNLSASSTATGYYYDSDYYGKAYTDQYISVTGGGFAHGEGDVYIDPTYFGYNQARLSNVTGSADGYYYGDLHSYSDVQGGGFYAYANGKVSVIGGDFYKNAATGDTFNFDANGTGKAATALSVGGVRVLGGGLSHYGGAPGDSLYIDPSTFYNNYANLTNVSNDTTASLKSATVGLLGAGGGAVYNDNGDVTIVDSKFGFNSVSGNGFSGSASQASDSYVNWYSTFAGGAVWMDGNAGDNLLIDPSGFYYNSVSQTNTTLYAYGGNSASTVASLGSYGGAVAQGYGTGTIIDGTFENNSAGNTEAASNVVSQGNASDTLFVAAVGGGVFQYDGNLSIDPSYFSNNQVNAEHTSSIATGDASANTRIYDARRRRRRRSRVRQRQHRLDAVPRQRRHDLRCQRQRHQQ